MYTPITTPALHHLLGQLGQRWVNQGVLDTAVVRTYAPTLVDHSPFWTAAQWEQWYAGQTPVCYGR